MLVTGVVLQGRYKVHEALGAGGFSTVYLAEDTRLAGRLVAVKENQDTSLAATRAFTQEAELLARLQHPNLPRVTDHFSEPSGHQYLVMDYVDGENLDDLVKRRGRMEEGAALAILREVTDAVTFLHHQHPQIVHRDIKPSNLIRRRLDGQIILVDFGIAKQQVAGGGTLTAARAATPGYAPPEQYFGRTDVRSDVYSLGATLYFLLTGVVPPEAPARSSGYESLTPPRKINPRISVGVAAVIVRAMDLDASLRFPDVSTLAGTLSAGSPANPQAIIPQIPVERSIRKWPFIVGLFLALIALIAAMLTLQQDKQPNQPGQGIVTVVARAEITSVSEPSAELDATVIQTRKTPTASPTETPTVVAPTNTATGLPTATLAPTTAPPTPTEPPPTSSPVPPTPTLAWVARAYPISIAGQANASTENGYEIPPLGQIELAGVLFDLPGGRNSVTTQAEPLPENPTLVSIPTQIERPQRVQLLLTGGDLFSQYMDQRIGVVRLRFASGATQEVSLTGGYNLREWKILDQATVATTTDPNVREVWRTASRDGGFGIIDMLTIDIASDNRSSTLVSVDVVDTSTQDVGSLDPAINLIGLSVIGLEPDRSRGSNSDTYAGVAACNPGQPCVLYDDQSWTQA